MESTDKYTYSPRLLPPLLTALIIAVMMSSPMCSFSTGVIVVIGLLQLAVSYISLWVYARLCRRVFRRKWLAIFSPFSLLIIPLPMYGVLYGMAEWILYGMAERREWSLLLFVGGDGVFGMISWGLQLALFAYGMVFSGNALLKNAPPFPKSRTISLMSALCELLSGCAVFLPGICSTLAEGDLSWLPLVLPPSLLFLLPPVVFLFVFRGNVHRSTGSAQ